VYVSEFSADNKRIRSLDAPVLSKADASEYGDSSSGFGIDILHFVRDPTFRLRATFHLLWRFQKSKAYKVKQIRQIALIVMILIKARSRRNGMLCEWMPSA